ncbi:MAG: 50S ribosomal protein L13 [Thiotrichales bacterium]|nr:50S ribosomal protein L13 [Thiotrichales bacterium]
MKTYSPKAADIKHDWLLVDATGKTLGRLASEVARRLRGKHKPTYSPHMDMGDYVVVINAKNIRITGNKLKDKIYYRYSGYPGGMHSTSLEKMLETTPERVVEQAVKGMLPKNPLGRAMYRKLRVYGGAEHQHAAQQPKALEV